MPFSRSYLFASFILVPFLCWACPEDYEVNVDENYQECMSNYDIKSQQRPVISDTQIDAVLRSLPIKTYAQLNADYVEYAKLNRTFKFTDKRSGKMLKLDYRNLRFYEIKGDDQFKYLVDEFRIVDFLPNWKSPGYEYDHYHSAARELACGPESEDHPQYLLIDPYLLKRFGLLLRLLRDSPKGYDHRAIRIYYAFRHPHMNDTIEGSKRSQHLWGKALDLEVGDINRDGQTDRRDKDIVLDLLERKVIGHRGGIGRYPHSPTEIHMDVRGWPARWDR